MKSVFYLALGCFILAASSVILSLLMGNLFSNGIVAIGIGFALIPFILFAVFGFLGGMKASAYNRSGILISSQIALYSYIPLIVVYLISSKSNKLEQILSSLNTSSESTLQISTSIDLATIIQSFIPFLVIATVMGKIGEIIAKKKYKDGVGSDKNVYSG